MRIVQGDRDDIILPPFTAQLTSELRANGVDVVERVYAGAGHEPTLTRSLPFALAFARSRVAARG